MKSSEVLELVRAGFTRDDIMVIAQAGGPDPTTPPAGPAPETAPAGNSGAQTNTEDTKAPETSTGGALDQLIAAIDAKFDAMTASLAKINPAINNVTPVGIDDIVKNFFEEE